MISHETIAMAGNSALTVITGSVKAVITFSITVSIILFASFMAAVDTCKVNKACSEKFAL